MKFRLKYDWHTHTIYSHGRGTVEENVLEARKKGLESIAITDHGPGHFGYGFRRKAVPRMRGEIDALNEKYDDIQIYMSVEANIINSSGRLDVKPEEFRLYDFVNAGYHFGTLGENPVASLLLHGCNLAASLLKRYPAWLVKKNTQLVVRALRANRITVLTHPGDKAKVDLAEVFRACEETGTLLEISNRHSQLTTEEIRMAAQYDVKFICGSDAHVPQRVGTCERSSERVLAAGLDPGRVVNLVQEEMPQKDAPEGA